MTRETARTWAEISLGNLEHNYRDLRACAPDSKFLGTVKANGYGHGAIPVARRLVELGTDYLAVACLDEAAELQRAGITAPILVLGYTHPALAAEAVELGVTQAVFTPELAKALSDAAGGLGKRAKIHLKADTGMSRLGVLDHDPEGAAAELAALCALPHLEPEGIFTHFANADGDEEYTMLQFTRFLDVLEELEGKYGRTFEIRHCAASAAVLNYPCTHMDMVRPGIALYGCYPDPSCEGLDGPGLKPVMSLYSRVAAVRDFPADTPVSYGCTASFGPDGGRTAVLPIGYADGLHRVLSNAGNVWLDGKCRPIMGRVCMDMCMIGLEESANVRPGDVAEVFGPHLPVERHAELAGTISYELLCAVAPRVPRIYTDA
ncbi:MAG: alanine racemase [Oscillospiraceae bacterium]|nr:alanine racemase [Oscillospiraceae bacterium]